MTLWLVQKLREWSDMMIVGIPLKVDGPPHSPGCMLIFDSYEAAVDWSGEPEHVKEIRLLESVEESDGNSNKR